MNLFDKDYIRQFKEWQHYLEGADFTDIKNDPKRYYIVTIVHYLHWTGPVYFNLIRPFHHLVVSRMAGAGAKSPN